MIRVLVVDDLKLIYQSLKETFVSTTDIEVVGFARDGSEALAKLKEVVAKTSQKQPHVVLIDVLMPIMGGIEATKEISKKFPDVNVIVLSSFEEKSLIIEAIGSGARGDLSKNLIADDLATAIRSVHQGGFYFPPEILNAYYRAKKTKQAIPQIEKTTTTRPNEKTQIIPGLTLSLALASLVTFLSNFTAFEVFNSLILAMLFGIFVRGFFRIPKVYQPGIEFSTKRILKLAIILMGFELSWENLSQLGVRGISIVILTFLASYIFGCRCGKYLGISGKLTGLIAAGTSICGASAVIATSTVVETKEEEVAQAIFLVIIFGATSMLIYPFLPQLLSLTPEQFGLWCGSSIHGLAQVIASSFQNGEISGKIATISKLARVMMLAPLILYLSWQKKQKSGQSAPRIEFPWFILGFLGVILVNSFNIFPEPTKDILSQSSKFLLASSLAAMGLKTDLKLIRRIKIPTLIKPFFLAAIAWIFVSSFSLGLIKFFY